ncbi:unnamed protein product [Polarella glacialis]|uniref:Uncharacterized protein n=1 Tax=Polarella glacialis TaxID=89957 RepID=A0A813DWK9_POLGL|nr:unnamed protein product [Polarella glacialis]
MRAKRLRFLRDEVFIARPTAGSMHDAYQDRQSASLVLSRKHFKSSLAKRLAGLEGEEEKASAEELERIRWALQLAEYIQEAGLPVVASVEATANPMETWKRLFGSRRARTLRNRSRSWRPVREYLLVATGSPWPLGVWALIDYLESLALSEARMSRSAPDAVAAALSVLELAGQVSEADSIAGDTLWKATVESWRVTLQTGAPPRVQAEATPLAIIISCELYLFVGANSRHLRAIAWLFLVMHWAALRADDVLHIGPARLALTATGLCGVLTQTKTTGPGRKTREVPFFIGRRCGLAGVDWIKEGFDFWCSEDYSFARGFFLMKSTADYSTPNKRLMSADLLVAHIRLILSTLRQIHRPKGFSAEWTLDASEAPLVHTALLLFFKGHGPRHRLPSVAAAMGVAKAERDFVGRWGVDARQSSEYVLTAGQVVRGVQETVMKGLCGAGRNYDEEELFEKLKRWCCDCGVDPECTRPLRTLLNTHRGWCLGQDFPALVINENGQEETVRPLSEDSIALPVTALPAEELKSSAGPAPCWVSVAKRSGFRRLHKWAGCGVNPWQVYTIDVWKPTAASADAVCKVCARFILVGALPEGTGSSSSGSSSSEDEPSEPPAKGAEAQVVGISPAQALGGIPSPVINLL